MNLVSKIYEGNSFFRFENQFKLSLNQAAFNDFNQNYGILFKNSKFTDEKIKQINKNLNLCLDKIFKDFDNQIPYNLDYKKYLIEYLAILKKMISESINNNLSVLLFENYKPKEVNVDENYENFLKNKYIFKRLDNDIKNKILKICNNKIQYFKKISQKKICSREELSINRGALVRRVISLLNKNFNSNGTNDLISKYMNTEYEVTACSLELSPSNSDWWKGYGQSEAKTKYAHIDNSPIYPKAICYLVNVDNANGPTSFFPGIYDNLNVNYLQDLVGRSVPIISSRKDAYYLRNIIKNSYNFFEHEIARKMFMSLPSELYFNSHIGWDINSNSALEEEFLKSEKEFVAESGSYVVFDGARLFHRGGMVKKDFRVALQIVFGKKLSKLSKLKKIINNVSKKFFT